MTDSAEERTWLDVAALGACAAVVLAFAGQVVLVGGPPSSSLDEFVLLLAAAGALCIVGLTRRRNATVAWLGIIAAFTMASLDLVATIRTNPTPIEPVALRGLALAACLEALGATFVAAIYATRRSRRLGPWVAWVAVAGIAIVGLSAILLIGGDVVTGTTTTVGSGIGFVNRTVLVVVALLTTLGAAGDLRPALRRTQLRLEIERLQDRDGPGRAARAGAIFLDEVAPGRTRAHRAAADERTRIAADLHAQVVPAVRQALDEAEHGGSPERLVASLRTVLADVDALAAERHSITLEALGLVPAIEQLAERTEERSDVRITIDVVSAAQPSTGPADEVGRPPRAVEIAALRIAQLALDNVVRHAPSASVHVEVVVDPAYVRLVVADDGPGLSAGSGESAAAVGRRGLVDMRMAAETCGGSLAAAPGDTGGAVITFSWPLDAQVAPRSYGMSRKPRGGTSAIPS